ncbi:MAG: hypothetical protein D6696_09260 [Acidobacteria bacterium]|nr:MAG: hypothetical protein D6696_09260 [Acidobacteriota bacterium]
MKGARTVPILAATALLLVVLAAPAGAQPTCTFGGLGLFFMDLKLPFSINLVPIGVTVLSPPTLSTRQGCEDWYEAVLQITIPDGCSQANIWIEFTDFPRGWTINLGDSLTNDGYGGATSEGDNAELQIHHDRLSVFPALFGVGDDVFSPLAEHGLILQDGSLKLTVGNQRVSWGPPYAVLDGGFLGLNTRLFSIPSDVDGRSVYLGVNRVIADNEDRKGCGVRRVLVSFE